MIWASGLALVQGALAGEAGMVTVEQRTQSFTIILNGSVSEVTPLFRPVREAEWAPDWSPRFIHLVQGVQREGVVFTRALERGEIANESFHHVSHLHVAWVYLAESSSVQQAATKMRDTLRRFAAAAGKPQKYHETITLFWVHLLSCAYAASRGGSLEDIVHANPQLLEKNFTLAYYSAGAAFTCRGRNF